MKLRFAVILALALSHPAGADEEAAARVFADAEAAFARGDARAAAVGFDEANRLSPHGKTTLNAGLAWEAAKEIAIAADRYAAALASSQLAPVRAQETGQKLAGLEKRLCLLSLSGPAAGLVSVAHVRASPLPLRVHLNPGLQRIELSLPGTPSETREITALAGTEVSLELSMPRPPEPSPVASAPVFPEAPASRGPWLAVGISGLGAGVLAGGAAAILGGLTMGALGSYRDSGYTDVAAFDRTQTLKTSTNVVVAVAVGLAVLGGAALILDQSTGPAP
ncbi:MAG: hypothetical protein U1E65_15335 [Myxococcota bacterium]